jgi:hypothetical protein
MRFCKTCGIPLFIAWLLYSWPWEKRVKKYKDADDCVDLLAHDWLKKEIG